jgi:hypothetical protein
MFKVKKPKSIPVINEGTLLYQAHCLYIKILRLEIDLGERIIPILHKNFVNAHYTYFYDVQYADSVLKVLKWNEKRIERFGFSKLVE